MRTDETIGTAPASDRLLTESEAATFLHVAIQTMRNWRWRGSGPRYRKVGPRLVRYVREDLVAFIEGLQDRSSAKRVG